MLYLFAMPSLARELVASSWMMSSVLALKPDLLTAVQMYLAEPIASTVRMLVSDANLVRVYKAADTSIVVKQYHTSLISNILLIPH